MVEAVQVNKAAVDRRAATHLARRSIKKKWQLAWLCRVVTLIDLTTLAGDDTASNVKRLCFKARNPIRSDIVEKLGLKDKNITVGAVCVYPNRVKEAVSSTHVTFYHIGEKSLPLSTENRQKTYTRLCPKTHTHTHTQKSSLKTPLDC